MSFVRGFADATSFSLLDTKKTKQKKVRRGCAPVPHSHGTAAVFYLIVTLKAVRRDARKLAASRRSNNSGARVGLLSCKAAHDRRPKFPHEPRRKILRALPWPTESGDGRSSFSDFFFFVEPYFYKQKAAAQPGTFSTTLVLTLRLRLRKR